ncbi:MAG: tyrosine-protein kinase family protein [Bacilli bacterium]|jgi:capsular exopolysaccharide synthesis family protein|nr:tyrosine-protein kinase family protein [Bacilli bacterium]
MSTSVNNHILMIPQDPMSAISDKYRTLRNKIEHPFDDTRNQVILITSAQPMEGKTTTAINLAVAYAQAEKKVLLIDGNLHEPALHLFFSLPNHYGLTNVLSKQYKLEEAVKESGFRNITLLPSGPFPTNSTDPLASPNTAAMISAAKLQYDVVLIDSPALLAVTAASQWAALSDGVLLVIRSGNTKREHVFQSKRLLDQLQAKFIGSVLNDSKVNRKESYDHYAAIRRA